MRVHRSYIVNTNNITAIERGSRIVFGEHYIPVGETYRAAFNAYLASRTIN
jgi:two-component system LytT family response regulator